ncbi:hypothetical protein ACIPK7_05255 [Pseudomonas sp. NPDC086581]|uniref:hypothetical protein n=1 Tax=Pseudomonas sp. NPDC086581 TaxID=3364432 RepID=UPI0037FED78E
MGMRPIRGAGGGNGQGSGSSSASGPEFEALQQHVADVLALVNSQMIGTDVVYYPVTDMAVPLKTWVGNSSGDTWVDLAAGTATLSSVLINALGTDARVALRLVLKSGATSYLLPGNLLQAGQAHRPAVGGLALGVGDKLQCLSDARVDWIASGTADLPYSSAVAVSKGSAWSDLLAGPGAVREVFAAFTGIGTATLSLRLQKAGGAVAALVEGETLTEASAKRLVSTLALETGDKLQVWSDRHVEWIATGNSR